MYALLLRYLPPRAAQVLLVLWYALLIAAVLLCAGDAPGEFRYGDL